MLSIKTLSSLVFGIGILSLIPATRLFKHEFKNMARSFSTAFDDAEKNTLDGIKFIWDDQWVHLRRSNTEHIIRIYAEAPVKHQAEELIRKIKDLI